MKRTIASLTCAVTAITLTGCGQDAQAEGSQRSITMGRIPASVYTPVGYGLATGYFDDKGIEIEMVDIQGAGAEVSALESGSMDMFSNTPIIAASANQAGSDFRVFCGSSTQTVTYLVAKSSDIPIATDESWEESLKTWEGLTVGVPTLGGNAEFITKDLMTQVGLDSDAVDLVAVGPPTGAAVEQLENGEIDLLYSWPYFTESLLDSTKPALQLSTTGPEAFVNQTAALWNSSSAWLEENSDLAAYFCDAYGELIDEIQDPANAEKVEEVLVDSNQIPQESVSAVREAALEPGGGLDILTNELDCKNVQDALALSVESGLLKQEAVADCDALVWTE